MLSSGPPEDCPKLTPIKAVLPPVLMPMGGDSTKQIRVTDTTKHKWEKVREP